MPLRRLASLLCLCFFAAPVWAQLDGLLQINDPLHHFLVRQQTLGRLPEAFLSHQPLSAYEAQRYLDSLNAKDLSRVDQQLYERFRRETTGPGVATFRKALPFLYRNGGDFIAATGDDYGIQVNPLLYLSYGQAQRTAREGRDAAIPVWQNTRGLRASGHVGPHIFFETRLEENQRRDPLPDFQEGQTTPRLGFTKFDRSNESYDYFVATGIAGFRSKHFEVRLGRDRNRWGAGVGSLILSNYATVYDQLQLRTTFWRLQFTNLFTGRAYPNLAALEERFTPRRYGAFHHLAINITDRLQAELFEAVMFASSDTTGLRDSGFDIGYLNPVIFYRAVESDRGSPDNVLLGGGLSWVALPGLQVYTQVIIDELVLGEIGKKTTSNKWGILAGLHVSDLPLSNATFRFEYARLRPFLYSHRLPSNAFIHYNDVLGHPAGPNAQDFDFSLDYQPLSRLRGAFYLSFTQRGRNTEAVNYGADPRRSAIEGTVPGDVVLLQGIRQNTMLAEGHVGYELLPDLFLELAIRAESVDDAETGTDRYIAPFVLMRWGLPFQRLRY